MIENQPPQQTKHWQAFISRQLGVTVFPVNHAPEITAPNSIHYVWFIREYKFRFEIYLAKSILGGTYGHFKGNDSISIFDNDSLNGTLNVKLTWTSNIYLYLLFRYPFEIERSLITK